MRGGACALPASRTQQLITASAALLPSGCLPASPASAAVMQFPADELRNRYFLIRAGQSEAESQGYTLKTPCGRRPCDAASAGKVQVRCRGGTP
jgi:hypothetical protein